MKNIRQQYEIQKKRAQETANFYGLCLDLVMVRQKNYKTRVSIVGNVITPAIVDMWKNDGAQVKTIQKIKPN